MKRTGSFTDYLFDRIFTDQRLLARAMADLIIDRIERLSRPIRRAMLKHPFVPSDIEEARERMERPLSLD